MGEGASARDWGGGVAPWDPFPPHHFEGLGAGGGESGAGDPAGAAWGRAAAGEGAHPNIPTVQTSSPLPGRWGALAGALRGSPLLSGGFLLFKQSPSLRTVDLDPPLTLEQTAQGVILCPCPSQDTGPAQGASEPWHGPALDKPSRSVPLPARALLSPCPAGACEPGSCVPSEYGTQATEGGGPGAF